MTMFLGSPFLVVQNTLNVESTVTWHGRQKKN
jgi:hypothetical protein